MSVPSSKSFSSIRDDYAFFENQSNEAAADLRAYLPHIKPFLDAPQVRLLDFGCGSGRFISRLLSTLFFDPHKLHLAVIEPDEVYLRNALVHLFDFTAHPITQGPALPPDITDRFDLILSNHVLYYVPDLENILQTILRALAAPGLFITSMAGRDNVLIQLWEKSFALINKPVPYHTAEDLESALNRLGQSYEKTPVEYELAFPDSEENRLKILRFLLSEHLAEMPQQAVLALLDPYVEGNKVVIRTGHHHYAVRR